jgi:hypothetical protein
MSLALLKGNPIANRKMQQLEVFSGFRNGDDSPIGEIPYKRLSGRFC